MEKYIFSFNQEKTEGEAKMNDLLGGKGANLAQMAKLGLPVPPGFTITTQVCNFFYKNNYRYPPGLEEELKKAVAEVERIKGAKFGNPENPLFFSVRSGARISMPGMMDTVLNLGFNDEIAKKLAEKNSRFAWNAYWRFIFMFADVVMGAPKEELDEVLEGIKKERGLKSDLELSAEDWKETGERLKTKVKHLTGREIPQDPWAQLWEAIGAVFKSWNTPRAVTYRKLNKIPDDWGTAVNVQSMVFGNFDERSASGVGFTRNPATGEKELYGEFLIQAQGEDVVAGIRTPQPIEKMKEIFPECYQELLRISEILEGYYKDMQDIEFTIESGKLWMLQTRTGKRTAQAAVKIALDMVKEKLIDKKEAILRIDPESIESFFRPSFDPKIKKEVLVKGLPASPGAAVGEVVFDPAEAEKLVDEGHKVILVRVETSPDDIHGMAVAEGILTSRGGMTSHAALVSRGMGKPCIVGAEEMYVDYKNQQFSVGGKVVKKGEIISLDGTRGEVYLGKLEMVPPQIPESLKEILSWADKERKLKVFTNADTPEQAKKAKEFGAQGIGLCRTEHMFFEESRIPVFRQMIMAENEKERREALEKIEPLQKGDFLEIFRVMDGLPVIIRLLDPPLHEFLPKTEEEIERFSKQSGLPKEAIVKKAEQLKELNPMLGHRGCRLGVTYPEIYETQVKAIVEAACQIKKEGGKVKPEIMIPLVFDETEFAILRSMIEEKIKEVLEKEKVDLEYKIGTMIELPRAALRAGEIAKEAEFFSFGTNDLTQTTLGISRDDAGRFLVKYLEKKIFKDDPFKSLDEKGVGELIRIATERGRKTRRDLEIGICGEHGGDPKSIEFCHRVGLDYVSCSPYRVPVARLAAAQAALKNKE